MKAYFGALAAGRTATTAKDYPRAEEQFSKCLSLVPGDARALAERGYARMLLGFEVDAEKDLRAAATSEPSATVKLQILHNQAGLARKRKAEAAAEAIEADRKHLAASQRLTGVHCQADASPSTLTPERPRSLERALERMLGAHAGAAQVAQAEVTFESRNASFADAHQISASDLQRDGSWVFLTNAAAEVSTANHVLFSRRGKLYLYPNMSTGRAQRCGQEGLAELKVGGGKAAPWHIVRTVVESMTAHGDGQSFCAWSGTEERLVVLDAETFEGVVEVAASARWKEHATDATQPTQLIEFEWELEHVAVKACGEPKIVPYVTE